MVWPSKLAGFKSLSVVVLRKWMPVPDVTIEHRNTVGSRELAVTTTRGDTYAGDWAQDAILSASGPQIGYSRTTGEVYGFTPDDLTLHTGIFGGYHYGANHIDQNIIGYLLRRNSPVCIYDIYGEVGKRTVESIPPELTDSIGIININADEGGKGKELEESLEQNRLTIVTPDSTDIYTEQFRECANTVIDTADNAYTQPVAFYVPHLDDVLSGDDVEAAEETFNNILSNTQIALVYHALRVTDLPNNSVEAIASEPGNRIVLRQPSFDDAKLLSSILGNPNVASAERAKSKPSVPQPTATPDSIVRIGDRRAIAQIHVYGDNRLLELELFPRLPPQRDTESASELLDGVSIES